MEGQVQNSQDSSKGNFVVPTVIAALIVFAVIGFYYYRISNTNTSIQPGKMMQNQNRMGPAMMQSVKYKNGTYSMTGNYVSPGGPREIGVKITLTDNGITEVEVIPTATDATSKRFQTEFVENFKPMVVGKNIDEVVLAKVSGSSLTPKGFNDAIEKIKVEAQS